MEQVEQKTNKNLSTFSKFTGCTLLMESHSMVSGCRAPGAYEVIGPFIGMGMVGFCFGIGLILVVKTVNNLEYCIEELTGR